MKKMSYTVRFLLAFLAVLFINTGHAENINTQGPPVIEVPFDYLFMRNGQTAYIQYDNKNIYRGIICDFFNEPYVNYIATWHFGDEDMKSYGPNKGKSLEIIFASPNPLEVNADAKGRITLTNPEKFAFTFKCKFLS